MLSDLVDILENYPAIIVSITSIATILLTILTADKARTRKNYLSDLMMEDGSSMYIMIAGMFIASILTPYTIIKFNLSQEVSLDVYSYLVIISSIFFFATPILLWLNRYDLHLITIKLYFLFAFLTEFLIPSYIQEYRWFFLGVATLNLLLTALTLWKSKIGWLPEVIFFVLTLVYLLGLNYLTLN